jgi:hypothetical protein
MMTGSEHLKVRRVCLWILLVATAFQGITPSAHNLASLKLFRILSSALPDAIPARSDVATGEKDDAGPDNAPDGAPSSVKDQRHKAPGVICLPVRTRSDAGARRYASVSPRIGDTSFRQCVERLKAAQNCPLYLHCTSDTATALLHRLCRLSC